MPRSPEQRRLRRGGVIVLLVAAVIVAGVLVSHYGRLSTARAELEKDTAKGPEVQVVRATASGGMRDITILADVVPYQVATLYAKVSGYLGKVLVDKGDVVKSGQLPAAHHRKPGNRRAIPGATRQISPTSARSPAAAPTSRPSRTPLARGEGFRRMPTRASPRRR